MVTVQKQTKSGNWRSIKNEIQNTSEHLKAEWTAENNISNKQLVFAGSTTARAGTLLQSTKTRRCPLHNDNANNKTCLDNEFTSNETIINTIGKGKCTNNRNTAKLQKKLQNGHQHPMVLLYDVNPWITTTTLLLWCQSKAWMKERGDTKQHRYDMASLNRNCRTNIKQLNNPTQYNLAFFANGSTSEPNAEILEQGSEHFLCGATWAFSILNGGPLHQ